MQNLCQIFPKKNKENVYFCADSVPDLGVSAVCGGCFGQIKGKNCVGWNSARGWHTRRTRLLRVTGGQWRNYDSNSAHLSVLSGLNVDLICGVLTIMGSAAICFGTTGLSNLHPALTSKPNIKRTLALKLVCASSFHRFLLIRLF